MLIFFLLATFAPYEAIGNRLPETPDRRQEKWVRIPGGGLIVLDG